jgi:DNA polymerase III delta subunit
MTEGQLRKSLAAGEIRNQYLLIGQEPILIERALNTIRDKIKVDESFDLDFFSLPDTGLDDIVAKLYLMPFGSGQRLIVVKGLGDIAEGELEDLAEAVSGSKSNNCLVLIYRFDKEVTGRKRKMAQLDKLFPNADHVLVGTEQGKVRKWIQSAISRDNLKLDSTMVTYLEKEFSNDVTGLKHELDKIKNYLHEAGDIDSDGMRDLAKGLCDLTKYQMVDAFMKGSPDALKIFEELLTTSPKYAVLVDALARQMVNRARRKDGVTHTNRTALVDVVAQLAVIDRKVKTSSIFERLSMELFILRNAGAFKNGVLYGR